MNIAGVVFPAFNAYDGVAYEIYVSGCTNACYNCHSPALMDFNYGSPIDLAKLVADIDVKRDWIDTIAILGGDLLCQDKFDAMRLVTVLKANFSDKKFWLFTGSEIEDIPSWMKEIFDVIKTGKYVEELKQVGFPASSNQKVLKRGIDY